MEFNDRPTRETVPPLDRPYRIKIASLAFWFWFFIGIESCITFVLFQSRPMLGTVVGYLPPAILVSLLASSLLMGKSLRRSPILKSLAAKFLLTLILWAGMTLTWTGAASRFSAAGYWMTLTIKVLIVIFLFSFDDIERIAIKSLQGLTWGSVVLAIVPFIFNAYTLDGRLGNEEFLHPNNIGNQIAVTCLCTIYLALQSWGKPAQRRPYLFILAFLFFTLLKSLSKTSILSFMIAALVYIVRSSISLNRKFQLILVSTGILAISSAALSSYLDQYLNEQQGGEALTTATGRTVIWKIAWQMVKENPIWGYGYQSYRDVAPQSIALRLVHPHNEVLNIWFNLGGIGLAIAGLTYLAYCLLIHQSRKAKLPQEALGSALLVYFLIRGLTEATVPDFLVYPSALMMFMIAWMTPRKKATLKTGEGCG